MWYTAGYVIRKIEQIYSHQSTQEAIECTTALKEMAGKLTTRDTVPCASEHRSSDWTRLTDHGGLYHVEDIVYDLFVSIELLANKELCDGDTLLGPCLPAAPHRDRFFPAGGLLTCIVRLRRRSDRYGERNFSRKLELIDVELSLWLSQLVLVLLKLVLASGSSSISGIRSGRVLIV